MPVEYLITDSSLVPFCDDDRQDPWGVERFTKAKFQLCELTNKYYRENDYNHKCPWVNTPQNVYLLVGSEHSEGYLETGEQTWEQVLTEEQYKTLKNDHEIVLGYFVGEKDEEDRIIKIHWIQSFVKRKGIMRHMLRRVWKGDIKGYNEFIPWDVENAPDYVKKIWQKFIPWGIENFPDYQKKIWERCTSTD